MANGVGLHPNDPDYAPSRCENCGEPFGKHPDENFPRQCGNCDRDCCEMCTRGGWCLKCVEREQVEADTKQYGSDPYDNTGDDGK